MGLNQPGTEKELTNCLDEAERFYERSLNPIIVYWDETVERFRIGYQSQYRERKEYIEVTRIPK